ncbi:large conductance mechanosensitive channel protein MscL [Nocardia sp. NPDC005366]|uniref:large conductance mechanosensitive channel protein MscL n=1 Tax=Nocardia sp. NPDC005366 TaxID=3156878 RepID=UPI0033AC81E1
MFKGFKDFLMRGNVIDLAVAVVIGTAFTAVVTSVTKGIINPLLAVFGTTGDLGLGFHIVSSKPATFVEVGPLITALLNFVLIAAVLYFVLILPMKTLTNRFGTPKASEPTEIELLIQIRDLMAAQNADTPAQNDADTLSQLDDDLDSSIGDSLTEKNRVADNGDSDARRHDARTADSRTRG